MVSKQEIVHVAVGFVTGRKNFKNVAQAYLKSWKATREAEGESKKYVLHLFVAYDLKYRDTKAADYQISDDSILDLVASAYYISPAAIAEEARLLCKEKRLTREEAQLLFGEGYAKKRNAVLYFALKQKMDVLVFLDDDEYPMALVKTELGLVWKGQDVLSAHLSAIGSCDITHGHHCGYISPIPCPVFHQGLSREDFARFIGCISNELVTWASVEKKMENGGVTYADPGVLAGNRVTEVEESQGMKFLSGANLALNLKDRKKLFPFYTPPGARGEDTFLSTCVGSCTVHRVPCYTFHDGFLTYPALLQGVLPQVMTQSNRKTEGAVKRFSQAAVGWMRYKPLLLYITCPETYEERMHQVQTDLEQVLPAIAAYFKEPRFLTILAELHFYHTHVAAHFQEFAALKQAWVRLLSSGV